MTSTTETSTELTRSIFTDEWMAEKVRAEGASLTSLAEGFMLDGVNVLDDEGDGVFNLDLIEDKDFLRGMPFMITRWRFNTSEDYRDEEGNPGVFVSVEIAYQTSPKAPLMTGVFNDGSTGIRAQLEKITERRKANRKGDPYAGRMVRRGLRRSDYQIPKIGKDGQPVMKDGVPVTEAATTYYLDI